MASTGSLWTSISATISKVIKTDNPPLTILPLFHNNGQQHQFESSHQQQGETEDAALGDDLTHEVDVRPTIREGIGVEQLRALQTNLIDFQDEMSSLSQITGALIESISRALRRDVLSLQRDVAQDDHAVLTPPLRLNPSIHAESVEDVSFPGAFENRERPNTSPIQLSTPPESPRLPVDPSYSGVRPLDASASTESTTLSTIFFTPGPPFPVDDRSRSGSGLSYLGSDEAGDANFVVRLGSNDSRSIAASSPRRAGPSNSRGFEDASDGSVHRHSPSLLFGEDVLSSSSEAPIAASNIFSEELQLLANGTFNNGQKLESYQLEHLRLLLEKELGEKVCRSHPGNSVGHVLAYKPGLERMAVVIALIACNPPPADFTGARNTLIVVKSKKMIQRWVEQIKKLTPHQNVVCFNSNTSQLNTNSEAIILVTMSDLQDFKDILCRPNYYRAVLDVAGYYKNPASPTTKVLWDIVKQHGLFLIDENPEKKHYYVLFRFLDVTYRGIQDYERFKQVIFARTNEGKARADRILKVLKEDFCIFTFDSEDSTE